MQFAFGLGRQQQCAAIGRRVHQFGHADATGRTLYALYHNENYPETLPYDPATGEGLRADDWPPGLTGPESVQAVPRIGIMKSTDGGLSWANHGILLEDRDERMIRLPVNRNNCFPGGVGDPARDQHLQQDVRYGFTDLG